MRDPQRIDKILALVRTAWMESPDMRLGQLLQNVTGNRDQWNVEDDVLEDDLIEWIHTSRAWSPR